MVQEPDDGSDPRRPLRTFISWLAILGGTLFMFGITVGVMYLGATRETLQQIVREHFRALFGIPTMSICSLLLVFLFQVAAGGKLEFETPFGFKFRGASGPIVLFVLCYLAFTVSLTVLW